MNELVERLTQGPHPIVSDRSASPRELREQIERGFVLLKFPNTRGGTELGSQLDMGQTRLDGADFENGTGSVHLVGTLTLNYDKVQLVADVDLASLKGTGHLVLIEEAAASKAQGVRNGSVETNGSGSKHEKDHNTADDGAAGAAIAHGDSQKASKAASPKMKIKVKAKKKTAARRVADAS